MATQNIESDAKTHTLRVLEGGNAHLCLMSLGCLTVSQTTVPAVHFSIGREGGNFVYWPLVITAYEIIAPPHTVSMKAVLEHDKDCLYPASRNRQKREFVFTNYNTSTRSGWVQIPEDYLERILSQLREE